MNDADRIRALRDEGRIDDAQAQRLLQALDAISAEEAGTAPTFSRPAAPPAPPEGHAPPTPEAPRGAQAPPPPSEAPRANAESPRPAASDAPAAVDALEDVDRWTRIELFACAVEAEVDPSITAPALDARLGEVHLEETGSGWRITQGGPREGTWLERLVDGVRGTRVHLRLPPRTGVDLDVKAGDVELSGVPALRGRLMAGDLDARGLRAVDIAVNAGDLDLRLDPAPGLHRVRLSVGDAEVRLPRSADVRVEGHVSIGDASASAPFGTERKGMVAESVEGVMGEGRATLRIDVGTGDLDVKVDRDGR
jgi:hypothetical protein